jgi:molecular chaperone Hsp33
MLMSANEGPGESTVRRYLDRDRNTVAARGDFSGLFAAYLDHAERWQSEPDGLSQVMMRQALGAAALQLSCRPNDELVAWTLNIVKPPLNIFVTGDSGERSVVGRVFTENVETTDASRFFVESRRPRREPSRSTILVEGLDVLQILEQYYRQSEQTFARFFELDDAEFAMVQTMPDVDQDWLADLDRTQLIAYVNSDLAPVDEQVFRLHCGCTPDRMLEVIGGIFKGREDELFLGEDGVQTNCPRCGRHWWVTRADFDRGTIESPEDPPDSTG